MSEKQPKCWRYYLRGTHEDRFEWAEVVLCSTGFFGAVTDYGNYAFAWRSFGGDRGVDFRDFFVDIDASYMHGKITGCSGHKREVYDGEASLKAVKQAIIERRRDALRYPGTKRAWSKEQARDAWNELSDEHSYLDSEFSWNEWALHSEWAGKLGNLHDLYEDFYLTMPEPQSWMFCTKLLPRIQEAVRAELAAEAAAATAAL